MMHISKIERFLSWSVIQQKRKNGLCGWNAEAEARMIESKDWIRNKYGSVLCNNSEKHLNAVIKQQRKLQGQLDWDHSWGKIGSEKKKEKDGGFEAGGSMASTSGQIGEQIEG